MCSVQEDDGACYLEANTKLLKPGSMCRKCQTEKACIVLQIRDAYCRECFLAFCAHKFRAILGKSRILHGNVAKPILLAFSGSGASVTLLKLVMESVSLDLQQRRLMAKPSIVYIDEGAVVGASCEERKKQCLDILAVVNDSGFPAYVVPLTLGETLPQELSQSSTNVVTDFDKEVSDLFTSLKDSTSKIDMLQRIRHRVLVSVARKLAIDKVFLAETGTSLAAKILIKDFVTSVQRDFPSTVSTIYRTGDKLKSPARDSEDSCVLCRGPLDTAPRECSALEATEFSRAISSPSQETCDGVVRSCGKSQCGCEEQSAALKLEQVLTELCYSCRLLARNMTSVNLLPTSVLGNIREQVSFKQMKNEIQDFLLE
ncbi:hypothetical protein B566_EDAN004138 [Ephemera danica]|nr:hypothetical protein B566_EDAN004138 [Ephemera danica]